jgi:hypothetical protein
MNRKKRNTYNRTLFIIILTITFLILFPVIISLLRSNNRYPILANSRDVLSILADIVQSLGFVSLIFLIFDKSEKDQEEKRKKTPKIIIDFACFEYFLLPKREERALCEQTEGEILNLINKQSPEDIDFNHTNEYLDLWKRMGPPQEVKELYIHIGLINVQGIANNVRLCIRLDYKESKEAVQTEKMFVVCPTKGMTINSNNSKPLFVRCSNSKMQNYKFVSGEIVDYFCENIDGETIKGSNNKYEGYPIPSSDVEKGDKQ